MKIRGGLQSFSHDCVDFVPVLFVKVLNTTKPRKPTMWYPSDLMQHEVRDEYGKWVMKKKPFRKKDYGR